MKTQVMLKELCCSRHMSHVNLCTTNSQTCVHKKAQRAHICTQLTKHKHPYAPSQTNMTHLPGELSAAPLAAVRMPPPHPKPAPLLAASAAAPVGPAVAPAQQQQRGMSRKPC
jgi:hypothetical protein